MKNERALWIGHMPRAIEVAAIAHHGQMRKDGCTPYLAHPMAVGMILLGYGYGEAVAMAGFLHDVIEDTQWTGDDIEREFGPEIRKLVEGASEPDKSLSWKERKVETIETLPDKTLDTKRVIAADKTNNLETLCADLAVNGDKVWTRFNKAARTGDDQLWYYSNVARILSGIDEPLFVRLNDAVKSLTLYVESPTK